MDTPAIGWSRNVAEAAWIGPRLDAFGSGVVGSVIPNGFAAYARLLHPAVRDHGSGERVRWREVAEWSGLPLNRQAQFVDVAMPQRLPQAPAPWTDPPAEGTLPRQDATALVELLAKHTGPQQCWFCVWDGYGWLTGSIATVSAYLPDNAEPRPDAVPAPVPEAPHEPHPQPDFPDSLVRLPSREYLLYTGPLRDALALLGSEEQTPNLFWPHDRSWCVATEIDLDSTFLAGSSALIEDVLAAPTLEALPAHTRDSVLRRAPEWVTRVARPAVAELLEHGSTTLTVDYGTVQAHVRPPTRTEPAWIWTSSEGFGKSSGGGSAISTASDEAQRRHIEHEIIEALLRFVIS